MPKPILKSVEKRKWDTLDVVQQKRFNQEESRMNKLELDRLLRKPRSKKYMEALTHLDAGGHTQNQHRINEIINTIRNEFPEIEIAGVLLGIVSICYLGKPYEVHTLDIGGNIIEHYKMGQPLIAGLEKARGIALRGGYACIEVYVDCCRAISINGDVSVIPC